MRRLLVVVPLLLAGCLNPDHIEMEPSQLTLHRRGDEVWLHAVFKDNRGKQYPKQETSWSSSNDAVAKVDNKDKPGNVVAVGPGHATITVTGAGLSAEVPVDVITVEGVKVSPTAIKMTVDGERVPVQVVALDHQGRPLKDRKAHMKCANEKICNSDGDGVWPAGDPGETTLEVSIDDKTLTVPVTVEKGAGAAKKK